MKTHLNFYGYLKIRSLTALILSLGLSACGGSGIITTTSTDTAGDGGIIGTAAYRIAADSNDTIELKAQDGEKATDTISSDGTYGFNNVSKQTYLLRSVQSRTSLLEATITQLPTVSTNTPTPLAMRTVTPLTAPATTIPVPEDNEFYVYSIAHSDGENDIVRNLHPFTDLIVRNWFATKGLDIDAEFDSASPISQLPTLEEINAIESEIEGVVSELLKDYDIDNGIDLLATPFVQEDKISNFLVNNDVVINDNEVTLIFNQNVPENSGSLDQTEGVSVNTLALNTVLTLDADNPPTTPQQVRALLAGLDEIAIVWEVSTDDKGVAAYNVYRNGTLQGTTPYPVFIDTGLERNTNYSYTVEAIDSRQQRSNKSAATTPITVGEIDNTAPPTANNPLAIVSLNDVVITWTQNSIEDVAAFRVLRGTAGNVNTEIAQVTSSTFIDYNLTSSNTPYCYRIISIDASGNSSDASNEVCATVSGSSATASLAFSMSNYNVSEPANETQQDITITVTRTGDIGQPLSVDYTTLGLTATEGLDFLASSGTLTWGANERASKTFTITILGDDEAHFDTITELVRLSLSNAVGAIITLPEATLTIVDNAST